MEIGMRMDIHWEKSDVEPNIYERTRMEFKTEEFMPVGEFQVITYCHTDKPSEDWIVYVHSKDKEKGVATQNIMPLEQYVMWGNSYPTEGELTIAP